jgi:hypothetical protein
MYYDTKDCNPGQQAVDCNEGAVGLPIVDQFNKGGNCKLQGDLFIFFAKFSMGMFNIGGNC